MAKRPTRATKTQSPGEPAPGPKRRRMILGREPVNVPQGEKPGHAWANEHNDSGPTPLQSLLDQIAEYCDPNIAPAKQVMIGLEDEGEPPGGYRGDPNNYTRAPWRAVVWIGPPQESEAVVGRMLDDDIVGEVLCIGADIWVDRPPGGDLDAHRQLVDELETRLAQKTMSTFASLPDQAVYRATRLAANRSIAGPPLVVTRHI